jgi:type VII secretion integral membrane protein EccD
VSSTDQGYAEPGTLVRISAVAGDRRVDLALPGGVAVAELLPEIARQVGVLDRETVHGGYRLVAQDGRVLSDEVGLIAQSIDDGHVLSVTVGADDPAPRVYDDIVEAMSDAVEKDVRPWEPASGRRTALVAAVLVLGLGALSLGLQRPGAIAGGAAGAIAVVLIASSLVLARLREEHETAVVLAWTAVLYAATAGLTAAPAGPLLKVPAALAGAGALVVGLIAVLGLVRHRTALVPAVSVGAVFAITSTVLSQLDVRPASAYAVGLVLVVAAGSALPWLSLAGTPTRVPQIHSEAEITADPVAIDETQVRRDARIGHEVLLAVTVTVGLLLVLVAPLLVGLGIAGALLGLCAAGVLILRTRQYRSGSEVLAGLAAGVAGLIVLGLAVAVLEPEWRPALAVVLALTGTLLLLATLVPATPSVRRGQLGDVAEGIALVALVPLLVVAVGLIGAVRG